MLITVLPYWLNLDSLSIIRLSSLILSLIISAYLFMIKSKLTRITLLACTMLGASLFNLSAFLEFAGTYYWRPYNLKNLIMPFIQNLGAAIALVSLLLLVYYFPHFQKPDRKELRVALLIFILANLAIFGLTFYNFIFLERMHSDFHFEKTYYIIFYISIAVQFVFIVFLLLRKTIRFSAGRSRSRWQKLIKPRGNYAIETRSLALVLFLPLGAFSGTILMTFGILPTLITTYFVWISFLLLYFNFVVIYLSHTPNPTTFQAKLIGFVLVVMMGIMGMVAIIVGKSYESDYINDNLISDHQTIRFTRNHNRSYDITQVPFRFDSEPGLKMEIEHGEVESHDLRFPFPFFNNIHQDIHILHGPMIYLGKEIREDGWGGYHPQPAIAPIIMNLDPSGGGGIFLKSEAERTTITWHELPELGFSNTNTVQLVLYKDGSFDISYKELNPGISHYTVQMHAFTTANMTGAHPGTRSKSAIFGPKLIGIHPGNRNVPLEPVRFSKELPYSSAAPGVIFEAYDIDYYRYFHGRMALLVVVLIASSLLILFFFPLLLKTSLIKPLHALYEGMRKVESGNLDATVSPQSNDEIGFLTRFFNQMVQSVKKAEANFWALAENARDGILITSESDIPIYANKRACEITGFTSVELKEINYKELVRFDEPLKIGEPSWKKPEEKQVLKYLEAHIKTKDRKEVPVELTVSDAVWHGRPADVIIIRDITERKKGEERARLQQQELMQMDKLTSLGVLAAGVAHEINNPNQTILSNASLLNRACPEILSILGDFYDESDDFLIAGLGQEEFRASFAAMLEGIEVCSTRIDRIIKNLKTFTRDTPGDFMAGLDINSVIQASVELLFNFIKRATENFSFHPGKDIPSIRGNAQRIEQVIINLILNACQSLPARDKAISVHSFYNEEKACILIEVRDEGIGIPEEQIAKIKDPFFSTKQAEGGSGLGLYVSETIIKEHNGTLSFMSEPGKGTVAVISFPIEEC